MTYDKSKEFLKRILTHNAIGFSEDFANRDYTVGYYIANARYRIERMRKYDRTLNNIESVKDVIQISLDDNTHRRKQEDIWDICYRALYTCFEHFKRKFRSD